MGDRDAAQDQVRATLTSLSRALLLRENVFPGARAELPAQLGEIDAAELGSMLLETICDEPGLDDLTEFLNHAESLAPTDASGPALRSTG